MVDNYRPRFFTVRGSQQVDTKKKDFEKEFFKKKEGNSEKRRDFQEYCAKTNYFCRACNKK
jgi:hypothetical protein